MAVDALKVQVLFSAIDRLTGPLKGMAGGSGKLQTAIAATRKEIQGLERAQGRVAGFRKAEADYRRLGDELRVARSEAKATKLELAAAEKPTAALARAAEKAAIAEAKAGKAYQMQGEKLQRLGNELEAAGVDITRLVEHEDRLAHKVYDANKALDAQQAKLEGIAKASARADKLKAVGDKVAGAGMALSLGVTLPAIAFAKTASDAANESRQAVGQVEAALASMGPKAGRTLEQLRLNAEKLQSTSLFDDDDIMRSLTANLLRFGKVTGPTFDRAQQAVVDMATRLKMDLQPATMLVGKALNDPAQGLAALGRVGAVSKEWVKENKKTIESLVASGQRTKAQAMLLKELENQFKGSAAAARANDPMGDSAEQFRTFQENVGGVVNILLPKLNAMLAKGLAAFNSLSPAMQENVVKGVALLAALGPVLVIVGKLVSGVAMLRKGYLALKAAQAASAATGAAGALSMGPLLIIVAIAAAIGVAAYLIYKHWDTIKGAFAAAGQWIAAKAEQLKAIFLRFPFMFGPLGVAVAFVMRNWQQIKGAFAAGASFLASLPARFLQFGAQIIQGLINGVTGKLAALKNTVVNAAKNAAKWFKDKLGIRSPSRVFMAFGGHITEGLSRGIAGGEGSALKRVDRLSSRVAGAFAAGSLVATPAASIAATPALSAPSSSASSAAAGSSSGAGAATAIHIGSLTIKIEQQPGENAEQLARRLADELAKLKATDNRSSYEDD